MECENCGHWISNNEDMYWSNESQQNVCKNCKDEEDYYLEHLEEYEEII